MYKIVRLFGDRDRASKRRTIKKNLTLAEAQAHCADPETSWKTCTSAKRKAYTKKHGPWFDAYDEQ